MSWSGLHSSEAITTGCCCHSAPPGISGGVPGYEGDSGWSTLKPPSGARHRSGRLHPPELKESVALAPQEKPAPAESSGRDHRHQHTSPCRATPSVAAGGRVVHGVACHPDWSLAPATHRPPGASLAGHWGPREIHLVMCPVSPRRCSLLHPFSNCRFPVHNKLRTTLGTVAINYSHNTIPAIYTQPSAHPSAAVCIMNEFRRNGNRHSHKQHV